MSYIVKGKMIGGFALIAYPAEYGNSGVMTFVVNHAGTVYQKDLGDLTEVMRSAEIVRPPIKPGRRSRSRARKQQESRSDGQILHKTCFGAAYYWPPLS